MKFVIFLYIDIHKGDEKNEKKMLTLRILLISISFRNVPSYTCYLDGFRIDFFIGLLIQPSKNEK